MSWSTDPETRAMVREHCEHEEKMSKVWSRSHDRILAEKCEGVTAFKGSDLPRGACRVNADPIWGSDPPEPDGLYILVKVDGDEGTDFYRDLYDYSSWVNDAIRAAEAWRKQKPGRYWTITSAGRVQLTGEDVMQAFCKEGDLLTLGQGYGPAALAWALWEAEQ